MLKYLSNIFKSMQLFPYPFFVVWGSTKYKVKGHHAREILNNLCIGDVLVRKYDHYITPWFIPGTWKHVGIYVGGNKVIHATIEGVIEEDILTYLRCDRIGILRVDRKHRSKVEKEVPEKAKKFLGLDYDFHFNTHDNKQLYCTELIKECYDDYGLTFRVKKSGRGKDAILPDYMLSCGLDLIYDSGAEQIKNK
jgi:uncharacterized protein YycO